MSEGLYKSLLETEQRYLWNDLITDLRQARNDYWSIASESRVMRIIWIAEVIGVTPWEQIQIPLLESGVYNAVRTKLGLEPVHPNLDAYRPAHTQHPDAWRNTIVRIADMTVDER